ncbi:hypothetical protein MIMGU_mgv1a023751mg [Erythranthe guttata]|uniref:Glutamate receptor n=2 Tax=Erythranthe guttata TaxID=4155 RepID=A0A022RZK5_ERYGU|nr:hypothetical protein MIMGU_mgv1a023751mg [Erythranthe guttata]
MAVASGAANASETAATAATESSPNNSTFRVGVILDLDSLIGRTGVNSLSLALSDFYSVNSNYTTRLVLHVRNSNEQVLDAASAALTLLKELEVDAIIGPQESEQANFLIRLGERANVPFISFSVTSPAVVHPSSSYFVQTAITDSAQVGAIASIIKHFQWNQIVLVYEDSHYGNSIIPYLVKSFQEVNARVTYRNSIATSATDDNVLQELYRMKTMQTRVFVVHMSSSLASRFFPHAKRAGMMVDGYAWILTSRLMDSLYSFESHVVIESMQGVLGVKPLIPRSEKLTSVSQRWKTKFVHDNPNYALQAELGLYGVWAYDTLFALAMAAERVKLRLPTSSQKTRFFDTEISLTGPKLLEAISEVTFKGLAGNFRLLNKQLEPSSFQILNVVGTGDREVGIWTPNEGIINKKLKSVIFPGESTVVPKGWEVVPAGGNKLRIGVPVQPGFSEFVKVEKDPRNNATLFSGCYIDTFDDVMAKLPYPVPYEFVAFEKSDGSSAGSYDELAYQVFLQNYDAAVGDITITYNRSKYVDFTIPFSEGGVDIIVPIAYDDLNSKWIFLKPLAKDLWLTAIALFILTGVALWILEHRFNSAYRGPPSNHAGMIFYFPFMSLVFAQRERIVSNLARLVVVVWMFVVLILSSTYTASLSARLTVQRLQPAVTDVLQLTRKGDFVGCHKGSFIFDLLQDLGFDKSKIKLYELPVEVHEALSEGSEKGGISAFFSVRAYTKLFLSNYCNKYTTVGPTYPTEGFAFVFPKASVLVADVSRAIIEQMQNGRIKGIERQWIKNPMCSGGSDGTVASNSVPLQSFRTLFGVTGGITATCVAVFLCRYLYQNRYFVRTVTSSSNTTFWSKVREVCKHFDGRENAATIGTNLVGNSSPRSSSTVVPVSSVHVEIIDGVNTVESISESASESTSESVSVSESTIV